MDTKNDGIKYIVTFNKFEDKWQKHTYMKKGQPTIVNFYIFSLCEFNVSCSIFLGRYRKIMKNIWILSVY